MGAAAPRHMSMGMGHQTPVHADWRTPRTSPAPSPVSIHGSRFLAHLTRMRRMFESRPRTVQVMSRRCWPTPMTASQQASMSAPAMIGRHVPDADDIHP